MSSSTFTISCKNCGLNELCLPRALSNDEMDAVDEAVKRSKPIQKNQPLYEVGDAFTCVFAARSGAVKTFTIDEEGEEHFIGFYLPGELVGLDVIGTEAYTNTAKALETSSLCEIPFDSTAEL